MKQAIIETIMLLTLLSAILIGCTPVTTSNVPVGFYNYSTAAANTTNETNTTVNTGVSLASWNIQILGRNKMADPIARQYIPQILQQYDIVTIQELSDGTGQTATALAGLMPGYSYLVSQREGRGTSKEQYLLFWKAPVTVSNPMTYPDPHNVFERRPWAVLVTTNTQRFILISEHAQPENVAKELTEMDLHALGWFESQYNTTTFLLAGDENADCSYYDPKTLTLHEYNWLITDGTKTNVHTSQDCTYDRLIASSDLKTSGAGVDHYDSRLGLNTSSALDVSDHYPVFVSIN